MKYTNFLRIAVMFCLAVPFAAYSQKEATQTIRGVVSDKSSEKPLANVIITVLGSG